jgi:hypothetical protein
MKNSESSTEYRKFDALMNRIVKVSHAEIKALLAEEKSAKKRKKLKVSSASRVGV